MVVLDPYAIRPGKLGALAHFVPIVPREAPEIDLRGFCMGSCRFFGS